MTDATWDTEETSRIIMNDEWLYNRAMQLSKKAYSVGRLARLLDDEFTDLIKDCPHCDIDVCTVDWDEIASDMMDDEVD